MGKKPATVEKQQTADGIIALIKTLSPEERDRVFKFTNGSTQNKGVSELLQAWIHAQKMFNKLLESVRKVVGDENTFRQLLTDEENTERAFEAVEQKADRLQPKRAMSKERIATAKVFEKLLKEKGKWDAALLKLVDELGEKEKRYAQKYRETKSYERLRNYIKAVMRDYKKHTARQSL